MFSHRFLFHSYIAKVISCGAFGPTTDDHAPLSWNQIFIDFVKLWSESFSVFYLFRSFLVSSTNSTAHRLRRSLWWYLNKPPSLSTSPSRWCFSSFDEVPLKVNWNLCAQQLASLYLFAVSLHFLILLPHRLAWFYSILLIDLAHSTQWNPFFTEYYRVSSCLYPILNWLTPPSKIHFFTTQGSPLHS